MKDKKQLLKIIIIIVILLVIGIILIMYFSNKNSIKNDEIDIEMYSDYKFIDEEFTYNYELVSSSEEKLALNFAYVNKECMKIEFVFFDKAKYDKKDKDTLTQQEIQHILEEKIENNLTNLSCQKAYIKTADDIIYNTCLGNNDDNGRSKVNVFSGINEYYETFSLTIDKATDEITAYFVNMNNKEIILNLRRIK